MPKISQAPKIELVVGLHLNEAEARALLCLTSFNVEEVAKILTQSLTQDFSRTHYEGLKSLLDCRADLSQVLGRLDAARKEFGK